MQQSHAFILERNYRRILAKKSLRRVARYFGIKNESGRQKREFNTLGKISQPSRCFMKYAKLLGKRRQQPGGSIDEGWNLIRNLSSGYTIWARSRNKQKFTELPTLIMLRKLKDGRILFRRKIIRAGKRER